MCQTPVVRQREKRRQSESFPIRSADHHKLEEQPLCANCAFLLATADVNQTLDREGNGWGVREHYIEAFKMQEIKKRNRYIDFLNPFIFGFFCKLSTV